MVPKCSIFPIFLANRSNAAFTTIYFFIIIKIICNWRVLGGGTDIRLFESKFKKIFIELRRKEEREERDRKVRGKLLQILGA